MQITFLVFVGVCSYVGLDVSNRLCSIDNVDYRKNLYEKLHYEMFVDKFILFIYLYLTNILKMKEEVLFCLEKNVVLTVSSRLSVL